MSERITRKMVTYRFPLGNGSYIDIAMPADVTLDEIDVLYEYLNLYRDRAHYVQDHAEAEREGVEGCG